MRNTPHKKIALVHDYLLRFGGAERVLRVMHEMFPDAPIYTVVYDEKFVRAFFGQAIVQGTFLQRLPLCVRKKYPYFSLLIPTAVEHLDLSEFDIVLSSCSAFCKGIITSPGTVHICYCHTPVRFLWDWTHPYASDLAKKGVRGLVSKIVLHLLRFWDQQAARRVDYFVANSKHVSSRIKKYYRKDAKVIYPPVSKLNPPIPYDAPRSAEVFDENGRTCEKPKTYFLIVSQLRPYKQIDIAIDAFKKLGFPLIIIGEGNAKKRLMELARGFENIQFLGFQPDYIVAEYYKNCKALIFPGEEDFGMTMAEAMLFGKPVLALRKGGAREILVEGLNGEFFEDPHPLVLADGVRRLLENYNQYSPLVIEKWAEKFSKERFQKQLFEFIEECCKI